MTNEVPNEETREQGHEPLRVDTRAVWYSALVLVLTIVAALLLMQVMLQWLSPEGTAVSVTDPMDQATPTEPSIPNIDANQIAQLEALRRMERELLTSYAWLDQTTGVARIPVERAMEIVGQRGPQAMPPSEVAATQTESITGQPAAAAEPATRPPGEGAESDANE